MPVLLIHQRALVGYHLTVALTGGLTDVKQLSNLVQAVWVPGCLAAIDLSRSFPYALNLESFKFSV